MEQSINPHAYCRLRFDEAAEEAIENLANVLQWHRNSPFEGLFVAQKDARAGTSETSSFFNNHLIRFSLSLSRVCVFEVDWTSFTRVACVFAFLSLCERGLSYSSRWWSSSSSLNSSFRSVGSPSVFNWISLFENLFISSSLQLREQEKNKSRRKGEYV